MKTEFSKLVRFLPLLALAVWVIGPRVAGQTQLEIRLTPQITVIGAPGAYVVEWAQVLGEATNWLPLTNVTLTGAPVVFDATATGKSERRFYRALCLSCTNTLGTNPPTNPDPTRLAWIPPGYFIMGSPINEVDRRSEEGPLTQVTLTRGFWMGKHEVTQGEYLALMGDNPSWFRDDPNLPVESISWVDATNYCAKLTESERLLRRLPTGYVYRLPTEAEWEYAARAGTTTRFSYGEDPDYSDLKNYAWYVDNSGDQTHPVGQKLANPWGLNDMYGNVWEWCLDWYGGYPGGIVTDPKGPSTGTARVRRGGTWMSYSTCRSAFRSAEKPERGAGATGFRVVLAPGQP